VIRFDVKFDEGTNGAFTTKEVTFPNGIYNDIDELIDAINIAYKCRITFLFRKKRLAVRF